MYSNHGPAKFTSTRGEEEIAKQVMELATKPVSKYDSWCIDCIIDAPKI